MQTDRTPTSLLERCRDPANADAWREFEARYTPLVIGYCLSRGVQLSDAEDISQVVIFSLSRRLPSFEYDHARGRFRDYLGRAVRHALARQRRSAQGPADAALRLMDADPVGASDDDALWDREWMRHHLRLAIAALRRTESPLHIQVFETLLGGASASRAAELHGLTAPGVRKIHQRIRARLRDLLDESVRKEDPADETGRCT